VSTLRLRNLPVRVRFSGMDDVRELDSVLNEEHRDVVAHQIEDTFVGVELGGEAACVSDGIRRTA